MRLPSWASTDEGTSAGTWVTKYTPTPLDRMSRAVRSIWSISASDASLNSRCASSKKKHSLGLGRSPASGSCSYSWASIQSMNVENSRGWSMTSDSSRMEMMPWPSGVVRSRSSTSNSGSPKKTSAPSCSRTTIERSSTPTEAGDIPP